MEEPDRLLLTPGCTSALALALSDLPWARGDIVVTSGHFTLAHDTPVNIIDTDAPEGDS